MPSFLFHIGELKHAVRENDYKRVRLALSGRIDKYDLEQTDSSGMTLLMMAAQGGQKIGFTYSQTPISVTVKNFWLLTDQAWIWFDFPDFKHDYIKEVDWSDVCFAVHGPLIFTVTVYDNSIIFLQIAHIRHPIAHP